MSAINLENIPGNSHKLTDNSATEVEVEETDEIKETDEITPIVKGKIVKKKNPIFGGFVDDAKEVITQKVTEEFAPRIIDGIADVLKFLVDIAIYGKDAKPRKSKKRGYVAYDDYFDDAYYPKPKRKIRNSIHASAIVDTFDDAQEVIKELKDRIRKYGKVSLYVLNQLVDQPGDFTDYNYGWVDPNLRGAYPSKCAEGYEIVMPVMIDLRDL